MAQLYKFVLSPNTGADAAYNMNLACPTFMYMPVVLQGSGLTLFLARVSN